MWNWVLLGRLVKRGGGVKCEDMNSTDEDLATCVQLTQQNVVAGKAQVAGWSGCVNGSGLQNNRNSFWIIGNSSKLAGNVTLFPLFSTNCLGINQKLNSASNTSNFVSISLT